MAGTHPRRTSATTARSSVYRWECRCQEPPVLLATYDRQGRINIKVRDRYWHIRGQVQAICPRCGAEHLLDLRGSRLDPPTGSAVERARGDATRSLV
jgi:hypothetical protein